MQRWWVFPILALFSLPLCAAEISKWVDSQGKVHYSDQPPPGAAAKKIEPPPPPLPAKAVRDAMTKGGPKTMAEKELDFRRRKVEAEETAEKARKAEVEAKAKKENCVSAQSQLRLRQEGTRLFTLNEQGERVYADDADRARLIANAQKEVDHWCK